MGMNVKSGVTVKAAVVIGREVWEGSLQALQELGFDMGSEPVNTWADIIERRVMARLSTVLDFYGGGDDADTD